MNWDKFRRISWPMHHVQSDNENKMQIEEAALDFTLAAKLKFSNSKCNTAQVCAQYYIPTSSISIQYILNVTFTKP